MSDLLGGKQIKFGIADTSHATVESRSAIDKDSALDEFRLFSYFECMFETVPCAILQMCNMNRATKDISFKY